MENEMSVTQTLVKIAALPEILKAAQILEQHKLLPEGERANDIVKRYVEANPDINMILTKSLFKSSSFMVSLNFSIF